MEKLRVKYGPVVQRHQSKLLFLMVGGLLFAIDFLVTLAVYYVLGTGAGAASAAGFCASFAVGFTLNKKLVFRHTAASRFGLRTQLVLYLLLALFNLVISTLIVELIVNLSVRIEIAKIAIVILIACWNYIILGRFIFGRR